MTNSRYCILIPAFRHTEPLKQVLSSLIPTGLPCLVVDDGNPDPLKDSLGELLFSSSLIQIKRLELNGGKGTACAAGLRWARELGFTHAVTLDADGQHDARDLPKVLDLSRRHPDALLLGKPLFGPDVPPARKWGRWISRAWAWAETLSFDIGDPLCGFRCYPLEATLRVINSWSLGKRMDFDPEMTVLLHWEKVPIINFDTRVLYPVGGISNFRLWRDNVGLVRLNTRLLFRLLLSNFRRGHP